MDNAIEKYNSLDDEAMKNTQIYLCEFALNVWSDFCAKNEKLKYRDSVVSMVHVVDTSLPEKALNAVKNGIVNKDLKAQYQEPIVALQDLDWVLPENIEYAYHAIYNLYRKYVNNQDIDDWIIANQAISSIENKLDGKQILIEAVRNVI